MYGAGEQLWFWAGVGGGDIDIMYECMVMVSNYGARVYRGTWW